MTQSGIWAATALAVSFTALDAAAVPVRYDLSLQAGSTTLTGAGFLEFDSADVSPSAVLDQNDLLDFELTFFDIPSSGETVTFDKDEVDSLAVTLDAAEEIADIAIFAQDTSDTNLFLGDLNDNSDDIKLAVVESLGPDPEFPLVYTVSATRGEAAIPEPGTLALLAAGATSVPLLRRRRARRLASAA